ncbi:MAG: hydroxyethylthiazole kinase [Gordonia sp. (in: high G+C Gram-positive bacteria)]|uniref:hydroxyethylthiazole kinase n=1 Tax=Gordonia sp. (in: high G+C Gram-positive bacteria) TaxID=84139 RepID=UPI0039E42B25
MLTRLRESTPLVQCLTNEVTTGFVANVLLAIGGSPAMCDVPGEAGPFAGVAGGVLINLGTPGAEQRDGMLEAAAAARDAGTPWVLDPVAVGSLPIRTALAAQLLELRPAVIRGNASEIRALGGLGEGARGVDAVDTVDAAQQAAVALARSSGAVVAVSGAIDLITDGDAVIRVANGDPLFTKVTGAGCALGAVVAAFASLGPDRLATTVAAVTSYTVAGEIAAEQARGPGSFAVAFLDALHGLDAETVAGRGRIGAAGERS